MKIYTFHHRGVMVQLYRANPATYDRPEPRGFMKAVYWRDGLASESDISFYPLSQWGGLREIKSHIIRAIDRGGIY